MRGLLLLMDWIRRLRSGLRRAERPSPKQKKPKQLVNDGMTISERIKAVDELALTRDLATNLRNMKEIIGASDDVGIREILITRQRIRAALVFVEGLVDSTAIESAIDNLTLETFQIARDGAKVEPLDTAIRDILISQKGIKTVSDFVGLWTEVSLGKTGLLVDGEGTCFVIDSQGWRSRGIEEPPSEPVIRGPHEGFVESIQVNLSLIRRRIRTPHLHVRILAIGRLTQTTVAYVYIKGLADDGLVQEVKHRLERIDIDGVLTSGYLEDFIEDTPFTIFPLVLNTERPDRVAAHILEGKVAIFTDGTPETLIVPVTLIATLQAPDDYYERATIGSFIRFVRIVAYTTAILLPGTYVALVNFHQELLPTALLLRVASFREGIPFPVVAEILVMEFLFEVLREAGVRLPRAIGSALSIVGALILGDAAIGSGLVSPSVVIIVALTAISSFSAPTFSAAIAGRLLRFVFIILAGTFGLFGLQFGLLVLITHLNSLRSFGEPYLSPMTPLILSDLKDTFIRAPWWRMVYRPGGRERKRQDIGQRPRPRPDESQS